MFNTSAATTINRFHCFFFHSSDRSLGVGVNHWQREKFYVLLCKPSTIDPPYTFLRAKYLEFFFYKKCEKLCLSYEDVPIRSEHNSDFDDGYRCCVLK